MGLFGFGKKKVVAEKNPMDCTNRETAWYFSDEGKACWEEAKSHATEMVNYVNANGFSLGTLNKYVSQDFRQLPLFPIKYVHEYMRSTNQFECDYYRGFFLYLALFLSGEGSDEDNHLNSKLAVRYPDFLNWDKNPLLRFFKSYYGRFENFYVKSSVGGSPLLYAPNAAVTVIRYIDRVVSEKDEDPTSEPWLSDRKVWTTTNIYTNEVSEIPLDKFHAAVKALAKYPDLLDF